MTLSISPEYSRDGEKTLRFHLIGLTSVAIPLIEKDAADTLESTPYPGADDRVAPSFAVGFMFLNAWEPGYSPQFAGWRVLPRFYAPESWRLPFRLGFVSEFSFQRAV